MKAAAFSLIALSMVFSATAFAEHDYHTEDCKGTQIKLTTFRHSTDNSYISVSTGANAVVASLIYDDLKADPAGEMLLVSGPVSNYQKNKNDDEYANYNRAVVVKSISPNAKQKLGLHNGQRILLSCESFDGGV